METSQQTVEDEEEGEEELQEEDEEYPTPKVSLSAPPVSNGFQTPVILH